MKKLLKLALLITIILCHTIVCFSIPGRSCTLQYRVSPCSPSSGCPCPYSITVSHCGGLSDYTCACYCYGSGGGGAMVINNMVKLAQSANYAVGIDTPNFRLVIYNINTEDITTLLTSTELDANFGVTAQGDSLWLGLGITINEATHYLKVEEMSQIWCNLPNTMPDLDSVRSLEVHEYDLRDYRLDNILKPYGTFYAYLDLNNKTELLNFEYQKESNSQNIQMQILNSIGQNIKYFDVKNNERYSLNNLPQGIYVVIISDGQAIIYRRKFIVM